MLDRVDLTVVVPVFRNASTLAPLATQLIEVLRALARAFLCTSEYRFWRGQRGRLAP